MKQWIYILSGCCTYICITSPQKAKLKTVKPLALGPTASDLLQYVYNVVTIAWLRFYFRNNCMNPRKHIFGWTIVHTWHLFICSYPQVVSQHLATKKISRKIFFLCWTIFLEIVFVSKAINIYRRCNYWNNYRAPQLSAKQHELKKTKY